MSELLLLIVDAATVLLFFLVIILAVYLLALVLHNRAAHELRRMNEQLRGYSAEIARLRQATSNYTRGDPEPYLGEVTRLREQLRMAEDEIAQVYRHRGGLVAARPTWRDELAAPFHLVRVRRALPGLQSEVRRAGDRVQEAAATATRLQKMAWTVALRARRVLQSAQEALQLVDNLKQRNVYGAALDERAYSARNASETLSRIDSLFLTEPEPIVLQGANKSAVAQAHSVLEACEPSVNHSIHQARTWHKAHVEAQSRVTALQQFVRRLHTSLSSVPAELDLDSTQAVTRDLVHATSQLMERLAHPEIEELGPITEQAAETYQRAQQISQQLVTVQEQIADLRDTMDELAQGSQLESQMTLLERATPYPLRWDVSRPRFTRLNQEARLLDRADQSRTPEQVAADLAAAQALNQSLAELSHHCAEVGQQHGQLVAILTGPDLDASWLSEARRLAERVAAYDPRNWPPGDAIAGLAADLEAVAARRNLLMPADPSLPLQESQLARMLETGRQVAAELRSTHARVANIRQRWLKLQSLRDSTHQTLSTVLAALSRIDLLAGANSALQAATAPDLARLLKRAEQLTVELDQTERGTVERKAQVVTRLADKVEAAANQWLDALNSDLARLELALAETLNRLADVAQLDEPGIAQAQELLRQAGSPPTGDHRPLGQLVIDLKLRNDRWQRGSATLRDLERIEAPVLQAHRKAEDQRASARAAVVAPIAPAWPPLPLPEDTGYERFLTLEAEWASLKGRRWSAIDLVAELGELAAEYRALAERGRLVLEHANQLQARLLALESELADLEGRWLQRETAATGNREKAAIRTWRSQIEREHHAIQTGYLEGTHSFEQALRWLQSLCERVRNAELVVDGQRINLGGDRTP